MSINKNLSGFAVGAITATIGGAIKYYFAILGTNWGGILLIGGMCLFAPLVGGVLGWIGAIIAKRIENSRRMNFIGGFLGGFLAVLILLPAPLLSIN